MSLRESESTPTENGMTTTSFHELPKKPKNCTTFLNNWKQQKRRDGQLSNNKSRAREKGHIHILSWSHNRTKKILHALKKNFTHRTKQYKSQGRDFWTIGFSFPSNFYLILSLKFCACLFWRFGHAGPLWHAKHFA